MNNMTAKKAPLFLSIFILVALACDMSVTVASPTAQVPAATSTVMPAAATLTQLPASPTESPATPVPATATLPPPTAQGVDVEVSQLKMVLSPAIASGASGSQMPRVDGADEPTWGKTPGHLQVKLEGYALQGRFHEPQIYVYPGLDYAQLVPAAFESIHRLDNILYVPGGPTLNDQLPGVPFFNAQQVFASNVQVISFQNGQGVRFLTEYAQYAASANNHDLFYHFQGLTRDGNYYVIAILPISVPLLAETSDPGAPLPTGGVPYSYYSDPNADMQLYYKSVTEILNATPSEMFTPSIDQLDQLIQSMQIAP